MLENNFNFNFTRYFCKVHTYTHINFLEFYTIFTDLFTLNVNMYTYVTEQPCIKFPDNTGGKLPFRGVINVSPGIRWRKRGPRAKGQSRERKRQREGRRTGPPRIGFLTVSEWVRPVPENRTSGRRTAASTTTGSCRGGQGFTGVKNGARRANTPSPPWLRAYLRIRLRMLWTRRPRRANRWRGKCGIVRFLKS